MGKDLKYFMRKQEEEVVTVPGPESFKDDEGHVINLEIRVLSSAEIRKINDAYRTKSVALDKKGNPYISNGQVVFRAEKDSDKILCHTIAEALVYPDLKSKELMDFYKCVDITEMPRLVFSRIDEFNAVSNAVLKACGIIEEETSEELVADAKN